MTWLRTTTIYTLVLTILFSSFSIFILHSIPAQALSGSEFKAGRIIDDSVFFNKDSMSVNQIQQFLNAKVPVCDRNRASSNPSYQPPWTCLKEYQENITTKANNIGQFNSDGTPKSVAGGKSAAQIIWDVGQQYGINPQVLIVMLQKEQSLITDNWPWNVQYQKAMGYACPDTAPCDEQYYGFYNQVSSAAWQLKRYMQFPDSYNYKAGVTRYIQYSPDATCGGTNVLIENPATAALYNYTPYQPNAGALSNLYGSSACGAYGNRNFWRFFNDWFGGTLAGDNYRIKKIVKSKFMSTEQVFTSTKTQIDLSYWPTSSGVQRKTIIYSPEGEIMDFLKINEADGQTQTIYFASSKSVYKVQGTNNTFGQPIKIISRDNIKKISYEKIIENTEDVYKLFILANDGPYEYWWRQSTPISEGFRLWNITNAVDIVKSNDINGKNEVYVATPYEVYRMKWPMNGNIERIKVLTINNIIDIEKQNLTDTTELLYTATSNAVYETWWRQNTGFSNAARLASTPSGRKNIAIEKTITNGIHQLYIADTEYSREIWWGNGNGLNEGRLIRISQNGISDIEKSSSGKFQNIYTSYDKFVFETWWGNGKLNNGPAIVDLSKF
jgi:hypothetical protein